MKIKSSLLALSLLASGCASTQHTEHKTHWSYSGPEAPQYWGNLSDKFASCSKGVNQSPVDLSNFIEAELTPLTIDYRTAASNIINNGHTIQVNFPAGNTLIADGHSYELKQFHFHSPSENHINGQSYPLEAHFVHVDEQGNIAVVAVMFEVGVENSSLKDIWALMPEKAMTKNSQLSGIAATSLFPENKDHYRFNGSLTTPPCTEGVLWLVMKYPVTVSAGQVEHFGHIIELPNNRPIQNTNARTILK